MLSCLVRYRARAVQRAAGRPALTLPGAASASAALHTRRCRLLRVALLLHAEAAMLLRHGLGDAAVKGAQAPRRWWVCAVRAGTSAAALPVRPTSGARVLAIVGAVRAFMAALVDEVGVAVRPLRMRCATSPTPSKQAPFTHSAAHT